MIPLTVPEVRRLLFLADAPPDQRQRGLNWSQWRRAHQATARRCHSARRARRHPPPSDRSLAPVVVTLPGIPALTDALGARLAPLLPAVAPKRGRPPRDPRPILGGIVWVMRTGASWREVPAQFGPWHTVYRRYRLWRHDSTWNRITAVLTVSQSAAPDSS